MNRIEAFRGRKFTIAYARDKSGESPGATFFESLSLEDKAKLMNLFRLAADQGSFHNDRKFGDLGEGLFEFKSHQIRMPFACAKERGRRIFREDQERTRLRLIERRDK
jgi:hypothetical protein